MIAADVAADAMWIYSTTAFPQSLTQHVRVIDGGRNVTIQGLLRRAGELVCEGDPLGHIVEPHGDELPGQSLRIDLTRR